MDQIKTPSIVIYHGPECADGFTAAWAVHRALGDSVLYVPANYGEAPPWDLINGRDVLLVDFSYPYDDLFNMSHICKSVTVLDHHKTAYEALMPLLADGTIEGVFDMEHSGARLAWNAFHRAPPSSLIRFVEDRDLWKHKMDHTKAINAAIGSYAKTFENWDMLHRLFVEGDLSPLIASGEAILRVQDQQIKQIVKGVRQIFLGGFRVPVANCPGFLASDVGNAMCGMHWSYNDDTLGVRVPFAATYFDGAEERYFSLRSTDAQEDASAVAKLYGGGGHRNACGFRIRLECAAVFGQE